MFSNVRNLFSGRRQGTTATPINTRQTTNKAAGRTPPASQGQTTRAKPAQRQPTQFELERAAHFSMKDDGLEAIPNYPDMRRLLDILQLNRNEKAPGLSTLLRRHFPASKGFEIDAYGNRFKTIRRANGEEPRVMFTSHFDTVSSDKKSEYHPICYNKKHDMLFRRDGNVLGADDGTGLWLMLNMIDEGVPGLYAFYMDEETGRKGSIWSLRNQPERYVNIDMAISFDRKGTEDIVATQRGDRCCSEDFQRELAAILTHIRLEITFKPGARGSFTDSATFMDDISECTNIAVGYDKQHTDQETQLVGFVARLREVLVLRGHLLNDKLPARRDPTPLPPPTYTGRGYTPGAYNPYGYRGTNTGAEWDAAQANSRASQNMADTVEDAFDDDDYFSLQDQWGLELLRTTDTVDLIEEFPDTIVDILELMGWGRDDIAEYIAQTHFGIELNEDPNAGTDT